MKDFENFQKKRVTNLNIMEAFCAYCVIKGNLFGPPVAKEEAAPQHLFFQIIQVEKLNPLGCNYIWPFELRRADKAPNLEKLHSVVYLVKYPEKWVSFLYSLPRNELTLIDPRAGARPEQEALTEDMYQIIENQLWIDPKSLGLKFIAIQAPESSDGGPELFSLYSRYINQKDAESVWRAEDHAIQHHSIALWALLILKQQNLARPLLFHWVMKRK